MFNYPWARVPDFTKIKKMNYEEYWQFRGWQIESKLKSREKIILSLIPEKKSVLDVGCGNSLLPIKLKEKDDKVIVADISELIINEYKKYNIQGMVLDLEKTTSINFDKKFDYVILSEVLEHMKNPEEIIEELKKYTDYFIITIPNSAYFQFRLGLLFGGRFFTQWVYHPAEHLRFWSHIDFLEWLKAMGLEIKKVMVPEESIFHGRLNLLPIIWKNMFGFRMVYLCKVK